jgi:hypothetical protein
MESWYIKYFELKEFAKQQVLTGLSALPLFPEAGHKTIMGKVISL